jgi:putative transposase
MIYPLVLELAADRIPVAVACRVLRFSKQASYRWRASPVTERDWADAHLTNAAVDTHRDDPTFGYRFIADDLAAAGHRVSERRVWRLCSQQRLWSLHAKKRGLHRKAGPPVHDDRVRRAFTAPDLDRLWLTYITEHPTGEGKLYLCAVKDACSRRIVGYSIGDRMQSSLAVAALQMAVQRRSPAGTVVHSDRGSSSVPSASSGQSRTPGSSDRWGGSGRARTTRRWNRSSPCCRRTSSTENDGRPGTSSDSRSSPGSRRPTTGSDASAVWGS